MTKNNKLSMLTKRISCLTLAAVTMLSFYPSVASAAQISARSVKIGNSVASANTSYDFTFTATASNIKSIKFQACDNASGACTQTGGASGFSSSAPGAALNGQPTGLGSGGTWAIDTSDATSLRIANASNTGAPSAGASVKFSNVHNPSATNSTFFVRITTYSGADWTGALDTGTVATSTAGQVTVTASVDETLTFTLGSTTVDLGKLSTAATGTGTSTMTVATNASTGYSINYSGTTLTSGSDTITPLTVAAGSSMDSKQFGINLINNTTPAVGSVISGSGSGAAATGYGTQNQFKFNPSGELIASATAATNSNIFTTSYIANIDGSTPAGAYSTVITYIATANF